MLEQYPSVALTLRILERMADDRLGRAFILKELRRIGQKHPLVSKTVDGFLRGKPAPVALRIARSWKPRSARDLTSIQRRQLEHAGRRYHGTKRSADDLLAKGGGESFLGFYEIRELSGPDGKALFDAHLYQVDSGTVFVHATTKVVAEVIQFAVECASEALAAGLEPVLADRATSRSRKKKRVARR